MAIFFFSPPAGGETVVAISFDLALPLTNPLRAPFQQGFILAISRRMPRALFFEVLSIHVPYSGRLPE